jgi:hypothetical protein
MKKKWDLNKQNFWIFFLLLISWCLLYTILYDKVFQWLVVGRWFSPGTPVSSANKTDHHDFTEILLKVALNTINRHKQSIWLEQ